MKQEDYFSTLLCLTYINFAASKSITKRLRLRPTDPLPKLELMGCFLDVSNDRALPDQFANLSGIERITTRLDQVLNQCARVAKDKRYEYFAIHSYGECYRGGENYTRHGESADCLKFGYKLRYGVGKENSSFVYKIIMKP